MNTYEAKVLLANSLRCLVMSMEQIRLREIEKVVGREEPMQDHLAECTAGLHPHEEMDVENCLEYLKKLYIGFKDASDHEILLENKFSIAELELGNICDMIIGFINHDYPDNLVACAREINQLAQKLLPAKGHHVKSHDHCMMVVMKFQKEAMTIIEKYGYKTWQDGMYSLPLGYLQSWMEREYWEA